MWEVRLYRFFSPHNSPFWIIACVPCAFLPHWFHEFPLFHYVHTLVVNVAMSSQTLKENLILLLRGDDQNLSPLSDGTSCCKFLGFSGRYLGCSSFLSVFSAHVLLARKYVNDAEQTLYKFIILGNPFGTLNHEVPTVTSLLLALST